MGRRVSTSFDTCPERRLCVTGQQNLVDQTDAMRSSENPSLTGSSCGPPPTHSASVSIALGRLRLGVLACCGLIALALAVQLLIWTMVSFTDIRWTTADEAAADAAVAAAEKSKSVPRVVVAEEKKKEPERPTPFDTEPAGATSDVEAVNPNRVLSRYDRLFAMASSLAGGLGALAVLALAPWIGLGVVLAASSGTTGVERTVSAFGWALIIGLLALPAGELVGLPWRDGALWSYADLTTIVDAPEGSGAGGIVFFARFLLMPLACVIGIVLVAARFSSGVEAGMLQREQLRLDPALESEAANIKPTTLHGGRTAAAMKVAVEQAGGVNQPTPIGQSDGPATVRQISTGDAPKRLI
jgi:hypothetical protein